MSAEDQKLLELAAKAAGLEVETYQGEGPFKGKLMRRVMPKPAPPGSERKVWNPLEDDGDAFRLMCSLQIAVMNKRDTDPCERNKSVVVFDFDQRRLVEKHKGDELAATRRAIVRAAAAIGEQP